MAKYKVEHALPTQQLIVNQAELEHHIDSTVDETIEEDTSNDSSGNGDETTVSTNSSDNHASTGLNDNIGNDNIRNDTSKPNSSMATVTRKGALKALKHKSHMLRKSKFKHTKNKFNLSIWNQP